MVKNRDLVIAVLFTFCLAAMLFLVKPIRSQTNPPYEHKLNEARDEAMSF